MKLEEILEQLKQKTLDLFDGDVEEIILSSHGYQTRYLTGLDTNQRKQYVKFKKFIAQWKEWPERILHPLMDGVVDSLSLLFLINVIAAGYPARYEDIMRFAARYIVPASATLGVLNNILEQRRFRFSIMPYYVWKGLTSGTNLSAFLNQFIFFNIASIIRAIKQLPHNHPVYISDALAWSLIGASSAVGVLEGMRTYHRLKTLRANILTLIIYDVRDHGTNPLIEELISDPEHNYATTMTRLQEFFKKAATNPFARRILTALIASSAGHNLVSEIELLAGLPYENPAEQITRFGVAITAGVIGSFTLGAPPELQSKTTIRIADFSINLIRALTLCLTFYRLFFHDAQARKNYGQDILEEQIFFWTALPFFIFISQLAINELHCRIYKRLYQRALGNDFEETLTYNLDNYRSDSEPASGANSAFISPQVSPRVEQGTQSRINEQQFQDGDSIASSFTHSPPDISPRETAPHSVSSRISKLFHLVRSKIYTEKKTTLEKEPLLQRSSETNHRKEKSHKRESSSSGEQSDFFKIDLGSPRDSTVEPSSTTAATSIDDATGVAITGSTVKPSSTIAATPPIKIPSLKGKEPFMGESLSPSENLLWRFSSLNISTTTENSSSRTHSTTVIPGRPRPA